MQNRICSQLSFLKLLVTAFAVWSCVATGSVNAQQRFKVQQRWTIGGDGSWDYMTVDSAAHRLYIAHQTQRSGCGS